jgi:hypothetical protein
MSRAPIHARHERDPGGFDVISRTERDHQPLHLAYTSMNVTTSASAAREVR